MMLLRMLLIIYIVDCVVESIFPLKYGFVNKEGKVLSHTQVYPIGTISVLGVNNK